MSEIQGHPPQIQGPGGTGTFPYNITIDYGNQLMEIVLNGNWEGGLDAPSPITMSVINTGAGTSMISFCFKLALPGQTVTATLSCDGVDYPITLSVPT
jgi:hypothetical protein